MNARFTLATRIASLVLMLTTLGGGLGCHRRAARQHADPPPVNETIRVVREAPDPAIAALFRDTTASSGLVGEGRTYNVQNATERQALQAALKRERALWRAAKPDAYRVLMRADCFCPGPRGWELLEVRPNQPIRVWDKTGRRVSPSEWSTFSIDALYDSFDRPNNQLSQVQIAFDERWHYPRYLRTSMIFPDGWSIMQIRSFRAM